MDTTAFTHLSDLHVAGAGAEDPWILSDTAATPDAVVAILRGMSPPPNFVTVSGDLAHRGHLASYRAVGDAPSGLPCPVIFGLGNHDDRRGHAEGLAGSAVTFVQLPSDRAGLERLPADVVRGFV